MIKVQYEHICDCCGKSVFERSVELVNRSDIPVPRNQNLIFYGATFCDDCSFILSNQLNELIIERRKESKKDVRK
jgi:hypothetical protein